MAAASSSSSSTLPLFWDLASSEETKRLTSSSKLVSTLFNQQSSLPSTSRNTLDAAATLPRDENGAGSLNQVQIQSAARLVEEKLDKLLAAEVSYSLRRLTRGLQSPREHSRLGFAVALTELLSRIQVLSVSDVLVLILQYSSPEGKVSRSEQKNFDFARLFGLQALVRSGSLFRSTTQPMEVSWAITVIIELGAKRAPLLESVGWVLVELLQGVTSPDTSVPSQAKAVALKALSEYATTQELSPEKLALLLKLSQLPSLDIKSPALASNKPILSSDNLPLLSKVLRNAPSAETLSEETDEASNLITSKSAPGKKSPQTGSFNPRVHFVWDIILDHYYGPHSVNEAHSQTPFPDFYTTCVDESMFANTASSERKSWGFQVFTKALPLATPTDKPLLFSPNFMRTWINQLSSKDRLLHKAATNAATVVQEVVSGDSHTAFALTSQLLGRHGSYNFDRITNTKTIESILASLDSAGVWEYTQYIVQTVSSSSEESKRRWGLDQLLALIRNTAIPTNDQVTESILEFFAAGGFFSWEVAPSGPSLLSHQPKPAFTEAVRALCRSRFLSCLTELTERTISLSETNGKSRRVQGVNSANQLWIARAWDIFTALSKNTKVFTPVAEDSVLQAVQSGSGLLEKVRKAYSRAKDDIHKNRLAAFESMLLATLLYIVDSSEDAADMMEPLQDCYASLFEVDFSKQLSGANTNAEDDNEEEEEEPTGIELLQDYLIGLLERPSAFLRAIAEQTFGVFVAEMNEASLDHLIDQLGLSEDAEEQADEDMDGAEGEEVDAEDGSSDTSSDSGSVESDAEESGDESSTEAPDLELRREVLEALKSVGMAEDEDGGGNEGSDVDNSAANSETEEVDSLPDLTDEQMLQVDDRLAEIFRSRVNNKKTEKEAKQDSIAFQNKILDLLAMFAKKRPESPLVLRLVRPLFVVATEGDSIDKQVSTKATTILRNNICKAKDAPMGQEFSSVGEDLEAVHSFAQKSTSGELSALASTVNLYLTRVLCSNKAGTEFAETNQEPLVAQYKSTLMDFLTRKTSELKPQFLLDAFKKFAIIGWSVQGDLLESCSPRGAAARSIKSFRQQQAVQMVSTVLNQVVTSPLEAIKADEILTAMQDTGALVFVSVSDAINSTAANVTTLKETLKLGLQAARLTKRFLSAQAESSDNSSTQLRQIWKPSKIQEAMASLSASDRFKNSSSLLGLLKQLNAIVDDSGGSKSNKNDKKRKSDVANGATANGQSEAMDTQGKPAGEGEKKAKKVKASSSSAVNGKTQKSKPSKAEA